MSSNLGDPCPHAQAYTSFPVTFPAPARGGLLFTNITGGATTIVLTTVGGETVTLPLGTISDSILYVPIQATAIVSAANIGTIVALWH